MVTNTHIEPATRTRRRKRRYMSDSKPATSRSPSRRAMLGGATACALPCQSLARAGDPALAVSQHWCELELEQHRLLLAWGDHEAWLFEHRNWPRLSKAERKAVPEAALL